MDFLKTCNFRSFLEITEVLLQNDKKDHSVFPLYKNSDFASLACKLKVQLTVLSLERETAPKQLRHRVPKKKAGSW